MKPWRVAAFGAAFTAAAFVAQAPATWADAVVDAASGHRLRLTQAEGTIWSGRGLLIDMSSSAAPATPKAVAPVAWRLGTGVSADGWLLLHVGNREPVGVIGVGPVGWSVGRLKLEGEAGPLLGLASSTLAAMAWSGRFDADIPQWHCDWRAQASAAPCIGQARIAWNGAGSRFVPGLHAGYALDIAARTDGSALDLTTPAGQPRLTGKGHWTPQGGLELGGSMDGVNAELRALLASLPLPLAFENGADGTRFQLRLPAR